jgi:hypothetical protein
MACSCKCMGALQSVLNKFIEAMFMCWDKCKAHIMRYHSQQAVKPYHPPWQFYLWEMLETWYSIFQ